MERFKDFISRGLRQKNISDNQQALNQENSISESAIPNILPVIEETPLALTDQDLLFPQTEILSEYTNNDTPQPEIETTNLYLHEETNPLLKESAEVPFDHYTVIADDDNDMAEYVKTLVTTFDAQDGRENDGVETAINSDDLFRKSLLGNHGRQANVVFLDDSYHIKEHLWKHNLNNIVALANELGIDFKPYTPRVQDRNSYSTRDATTDFLFNWTDSTTNAILLRLLGFTGNIYTISSAPPSVDEIMYTVRRLHSIVPSFPLELPINGISSKKQDPGSPVIRYANRLDEDGEWDAQYIRGGLHKTLRILLKR